LSFFDDEDGVLREQHRTPSPGRIRLLFIALVVVAAAGYVVLHLWSNDRVPLGTSVEGVSIGGLQRGAAIARLAQQLGSDLNRPVRLTSADHSYDFNPADAGVRVDFRGSVEATGVASGSWSPASLWRFLTHGGDRTAVVTVDRPTFDAALLRLTSRIGRPAVEGTLSFRNGHATAVYGRPGLAIDADATARMMPQLIFSDHAVEVPMTIRRPYVSPAQVRKALHDFGEPAMSGPVRFVFGGRSFIVSPKVFGRAIQMVPSNGGLVPLVGGSALERVLASSLKTIGPRPVNATVKLVDEHPVVVRAVAGAAYDTDDLARAFVAALTRSGSARVASVHAALTDPTVSTARVRGWHIQRRVATVTAKVDGALAMRLDGRLITPSRGLRLSEVLGGTSAPLGSALFQLAVRASMNIDSFSPTLAHDPSLPAGLAANDVELSAPAGRAWLIGVQRVGTRLARFTAWSAPGLHADLTVGPRTSPTMPRTAVSSSPECTPRAGRAGFSITVTRTGSGTPSTFESTYLPVNAVRCLPTPPTATPTG
jgi:hypothetical protein